MTPLKCYFICRNGMDESPITPQLMAPPQIGSLLFFQGEDHGYRVKDVQYQLAKGHGAPHYHTLLLANVLIERVEPR
jgi:hypothetical protein